MYTEENEEPPPDLKNEGGYRRPSGEQVHIEFIARRPRAGKVMAETMASALLHDDETLILR